MSIEFGPQASALEEGYKPVPRFANLGELELVPLVGEETKGIIGACLQAARERGMDLPQPSPSDRLEIVTILDGPVTDGASENIFAGPDFESDEHEEEA